ncbi:hypothetical protein CQA53_03525 [Helicobacter didelphidarum]|uniref:acylphosphatase n=1 Tax=Helicobacter didelphidarum TaxID=2040648 RepID=A0A3D8INL2_9HELI|nr:acylphosphatase [Helicobacter didelphidarum]RDU66525.1 hypothetical protein CQA53_03525 [Helicobacter didelphidarum]
MQHYKITAKGKVQGVGFRNFTKSYADTHGYHGSVQNLKNSFVEIFISLPKNELGNFLESLQKGNGKMKATSFEVELLESLNFADFKVLE